MTINTKYYLDSWSACSFSSLLIYNHCHLDKFEYRQTSLQIIIIIGRGSVYIVSNSWMKTQPSILFSLKSNIDECSYVTTSRNSYCPVNWNTNSCYIITNIFEMRSQAKGVCRLDVWKILSLRNFDFRVVTIVSINLPWNYMPTHKQPARSWDYEFSFVWATDMRTCHDWPCIGWTGIRRFRNGNHAVFKLQSERNFYYYYYSLHCCRYVYLNYFMVCVAQHCVDDPQREHYAVCEKTKCITYLYSIKHLHYPPSRANVGCI